MRGLAGVMSALTVLFSFCKPLTFDASIIIIRHQATVSPQMFTRLLQTFWFVLQTPVAHCSLSNPSYKLEQHPGSEQWRRSLSSLKAEQNFQPLLMIHTLTHCNNTKILSLTFSTLWLQSARSEVVSCTWLMGPSWAATTGLFLKEQPHLITP